MQCDRCQELLGPFLDGELAGPERQAVAEHLASCAACAAEAHDLRRLGQQLGEAGREIAPKALAVRIRGDLAKAAQSEPAVLAANPAPASWMTRHLRQAAALAAVCLVSVLASWWAATAWHGAARLEAEVVSAHIRSLLQDSPTQFASSDSHTVKPWFTGRVDFAPDVKDLAPEGFPLAGARVDYIGDRRVGALVYKRRLHVVTVFMWPATSAEPVAARGAQQKGYNIVQWSRGGIAYWAVSDLNAGELRQLQSLL